MPAAICRILIPLLLGACLPGCSSATILPGHRGLLYRPAAGGLQTQILAPGRHSVGLYDRIDDFDVTYSTRSEAMQNISSEGLKVDVRCSIIYRPIIDELYELASESGRDYYQKLIGPQFRTAVRKVFASHPLFDLQRKNIRLEEEIRAELRGRVIGKHVEVTDVTLEDISFGPEIADAIRRKLIRPQESGQILRGDSASSCECEQKSPAPLGGGAR
jgi:regulator of protease activity HflC (stomatin/prohibitin superfamily)